ncbi:MAG: hypothetical protein SFH39_09975, partial [Candidatus Magnetobacterium sp. LHC-1]
MTKFPAITALLLTCLMLCSVTLSAAEPGATWSDKKKEDEKVVFNFVGVELPAIAKFVSELTSKNIIFDEQLKG